MKPDTPPSLQLRPGAYYSNGGYGRAWGVREVLDVATTAGVTLVRFRGIAGTCRRKTGSCNQRDFLAWARYEVALNENSWQRVGFFAATLE
jgi:hypothetical protein